MHQGAYACLRRPYIVNASNTDAKCFLKSQNAVNTAQDPAETWHITILSAPRHRKEYKMSFRRYRTYQPGEFIIVACDTSSGGGDYSCAQFLSKTNIDVPVVFHSEITASEMTPRIAEELEKIYQQTSVRPVVAYETNNGGVFELQRLATLNRNGSWNMYLQKTQGTTDGIETTEKYGFSTNSATRPAILQILKEAIDNQLIKIYDKPTINEMFAFIIKPNGRPEAEQGAHDDLVMSLAIAWQMYQTENAPTNTGAGVLSTGNVSSFWG